MLGVVNVSFGARRRCAQCDRTFGYSVCICRKCCWFKSTVFNVVVVFLTLSENKFICCCIFLRLQCQCDCFVINKFQTVCFNSLIVNLKELADKGFILTYTVKRNTGGCARFECEFYILGVSVIYFAFSIIIA